jgi:DNA helicase IV
MNSYRHSGRGNYSPVYKSWGEEQIARFLDKNKIAYQYEYPLAVIDRGKTRLNYPDFRLPEYGIIIEYFGMNGDSGYDEKARHKMAVYKQAGIDGLYLTRDSLRGDWPTKILSGIENILKTRLDQFYRGTSYEHNSS